MPNREPVDRIVDGLLPFAVPTGDLNRYHQNPRRGDVNAVAESLRVNGQFKPIVVNRGTLTGRPSEILAGNHTWDAAKQRGWDQIAVTWVDVDDDAAARIVIVDNRTSDQAGYDTELLADILSALPDLDGTGYDQAALDDLLDSVELPTQLAAELTERDGDKTATEHLQWGYVQWGVIRVQITQDEVERLNNVHAEFYERRGTDTGFAHYLLDQGAQQESTDA
ncbi:ParB N-terminal domain-containing protein [Kitasatospora purpeofusca]|uniref:ParB N-terminal domain-containing protein n=1 Tax=Kitasatospora purpeofusca TaxID=67352 RepID=UPI002E0F15F2|nr:ParB N-terminal domain-containing protein [Kitasatospora purpeofusca]